MNESILAPPPQPPSMAEETATRQEHCAILEAWFLSHPLVEADPEMLTALVGPNYRSRIAELRRFPIPNMNIVNVPRFVVLSESRVNRKRHEPRRKRLLGGYMFKPYAADLGRDAGHPPVSGQLEMF